MITLQKSKDKDFVILNLTDFQLTPAEWDASHKNGAIISYTIDALMKKVKPDLITISGDLAWCGDCEALECMASFLDKYGVPYAVVWGNHDQDGGTDKLPIAEAVLSKHPLFTYERGPEQLGYGNYIINIEENGKSVEALIMMDSHDRVFHHTSEDGHEVKAWAKLTEEQIKWYSEQINALKCTGCGRSALIMHIPCFAYKEAFDCAYLGKEKYIPIADSYARELWTGECFGVQYEDICSYPENDGVFDAVLRENHTKNVLVGHDHKNCFSVVYKGVRLTFAVKTGAGCYWDPVMNGGTVLSVGKDCTRVHHEIIDVSHLL